MPTLTLRIDEELDALLTDLAREQKRSKSDLVRQMLRRQLALMRFEEARQALLPLGERAGLLTDEDVFELMS